MPDAMRTRQLAAHLFELLDDPQREQVEQWLANDPASADTLSAMRRALRESAGGGSEHPPESDVRAAVTGDRTTPTARDTLEHLIGCRDCGFLASVALAEREGPKMLDGREPGGTPNGWRQRSAAFARRVWAPAAALGGLALVVAVMRLAQPERMARQPIVPPGRTPGTQQGGPAPALWSHPLRLSATRGSDAPPKVMLYELTAPNLTLIFRLPSAAQGARWRLSTDGTTVLEGELPGGLADSGEGLEFALTVPVDPARGPGTYLLEVTDRAGERLGSWTFALAVE